MQAQDISLIGDRQLAKQFYDLAKAPDDKKMEYKLLTSARRLRNKIRRVTPRGNLGSGSVDQVYGEFIYPTGKLKNAVEARRFKRKIKGAPAVYVRVNKKKAPHAHLVEFGTKGYREPKKTQALRFYYQGEEVFARYVAAMPPNPFFRNTVDTNKSGVENDIKNDVIEILYEIAYRKY